MKVARREPRDPARRLRTDRGSTRGGFPTHSRWTFGYTVERSGQTADTASMHTHLLTASARQIGALCTPPPLVLAASRLDPRGLVLLLEWPPGDRRRRLFLDFEPDHATLHLIPAGREAAEPGGSALGERLVGRRLLGLEPGAEPRVWRLRFSPPPAGSASDRVSLLAAWTGRTGNLHLVDDKDMVLAALVPRGPAPGEPHRLPSRDAPAGAAETGGASGPETASPDAAQDLMERLRRMHEEAINRARSEARRAEQSRSVREETKRLLRLRRNLERERNDPQQGARLRRSGEAILSHLHAITRGETRLLVEGWGPEGGVLEVVLDPAKPPTENARQFFHLARRWERGEPHRKRRLEEIDRAIARLSLLAAKVDDAESALTEGAFSRKLDEALGFLRRSGGAAQSGKETGSSSGGGNRRESAGTERTDRSPSRGSRRDAASPDAASSTSSARGAPRDRRDAGFRPRRYTTREGWTVLVGRSNEENDWLTHRAAHPEDYWFHAHGCPGSHVVLQRAGRKDNPSVRTLEEAAAIAAFFSKARHSSKAPVIYTLKKYVRKPRGAKPGLAVCEREKTIMVRPQDPSEGREPEWMEE